MLERIVSKMREFVEAHGARLIVGLQASDDRLIQHLQAERIAFVAFDGAETFSDLYGAHWTPDGHKLVAERLLELLSESNVAKWKACPASFRFMSQAPTSQPQPRCARAR